MTIKEIKDLTKFLSDEDVEKIKNEIKSKETILKTDNMEEEEMTQVLNTLFAILVIEKSLELEIEGIEEIRAELEAELMESYKIYDAHMMKYKTQEKKKKKSWLLNFLFLSDRVNNQNKGINASNKAITNLKNELNQLKQQRSDENLREVAKGRRSPRFEEFCDKPHECTNPRHRHYDSPLGQCIHERRAHQDMERRNSRDHSHERSNGHVYTSQISDSRDVAGYIPQSGRNADIAAREGERVRPRGRGRAD